VTLHITNRSPRIAYLVVLLVFAVGLTTALVLAAERTTNQQRPSQSAATGICAGEAVC
jgi:hypothetical protein